VGGRLAVHASVIAFMVIWFTPILGLFISSIRTQADMATSGWWTVFVSPLLTGYNFQQAIRYVGVIDSGNTSLVIAVPVTIKTTLNSAIGA
jgi:alpha-glucoside transport system permease protein